MSQEMAILQGDSSQSRHEEMMIAMDHERPHMSMYELIKVIKGANGMPVLFVPSSDGRLAAVVVDGLQNLVPAENKQQDYRGWLLLVSSLVATVTFTAGLAPPGGFWADDDEAKGRVAGTSVMSDRFPRRYEFFHWGNTTAFFTSMMIIGMLAININNKRVAVVGHAGIVTLVGMSFACLAASYIAGTWDGPRLVFYVFILLALNMLYMVLPWLWRRLSGWLST